VVTGLFAAQDFSALIESKRAAYFPNTHVWLFQDIQAWNEDEHGKRIYWLTGNGGLGKIRG